MTRTSEISIRMYNVGFGDCFLLRIPTEQGERRMLVDCGFHSQGKGDYSDSDLVNQIKEDLNGDGLHVVVATHRHQGDARDRRPAAPLFQCGNESARASASCRRRVTTRRALSRPCTSGG